jgi:RimJ/RimL family protein N-acetyltransferase
MALTALDLIRTARMTCERLRAEHASEMVSLLTDPRIARTLWPEPEPPSEADAVASLASKLEHWERYGFGLWLLRDRDTGEMLGRGGLQYTFLEGIHEVEAGWAIVPERWGEGLATELAHACVEVAFRALALPQIVAFTLPDNIASRRVMEKTGFVYVREIEHARLLHVLYVRRASEDPDGGVAVDPTRSFG